MASNWKNISGGAWNNLANWFGGIPDSATSDATIGIAGTYSVAVDLGETFTVRDLGLANADATLANSGTLIVEGTAAVSNGIFVDSGVLDLTADGAKLSVSGGTFDLHNGIIKGGTLSTSGGVLKVSGGGTLDGTGAAGVTLTSGSTLRVTDNPGNIGALHLAGTFKNFGTTRLESVGDNIRLFVDGAVTLTGGGKLTLGDDIHNIIQPGPHGVASSLRNTDNTISGAGSISGDGRPGFGTLSLINEAAGVIRATSATNALSIADMTLTNNGLVEATAAGGLVLASPNDPFTLDQRGGGTLRAIGAGAHVDLLGATIKGGTLSTSEGASIDVKTGANKLDGTVSGGVTLAAGSALRITDAPGRIGSLAVSGTFANAGTVSLNSIGDNVRLNIENAVTLKGGGKITLGDSLGNIIQSGVQGAASGLRNVDNTISGAGFISGDNRPGAGTLSITNEAAGVINATGATNALTISDMVLANKGLVEATAAGGLVLGGFSSLVTLDQTGGGRLRAVGANSHVDLAGATIKGGTLLTSGGGVIRASASTSTLDGTAAGGLKITAGSDVRVLDGRFLRLTGTIANAGTIALDGIGNNTTVLVDKATVLKGGGHVVFGDDGPNRMFSFVSGSSLRNVDNTIEGSGTISTDNLSLTNEAGGTIDANGSAPLVIDGGFTNRGLIEATGQGVLQINGALNNLGLIRGVVSQNGSQTIVKADAAGQLHVTGGAGDNRVVVNKVPTKIDGGAGTDTLVIAASMKLATGSLAGIERIEIGDGLTVDLSSLKAGAAIAIASAAAGGSTVKGTQGTDSFSSGAGGDTMRGGAGNDIYVVQAGDHVVEATNEGTDTVKSSVSFTLGVNLENLQLIGNVALKAVGNKLKNTLSGNDGANTLDGMGDADVMKGGKGNDLYVVDNKGDKVIELAKGGTDRVLASVSHTLGANVENLTLTGKGRIDATGNGLANALAGNGAANMLSGLDGNDTITGFGGNDWILGGAGADKLYGGDGKKGIGADTFVFTELSDSTVSTKGRDTIFDFGSGDKIDLSAIDANGKEKGSPAFHFIETAKFSGHAGELRFDKAKSDTFIYADTNGDRHADMAIHLDDAMTLTKAMFVV